MVELNAIPNWTWFRAQNPGGSRFGVPLYCMVTLLLVGLSGVISAAPNLNGPVPNLAPEFRQSALVKLEQVQAAFAKDPESTTNAWQLARAFFVLGEFATNSTERAQLATDGIAVSARLIDRAPMIAEGWYYHGLNSGQLARTKMLGALPIVRDMERSFTRSVALNPRLDHAGAHRCLALLYRDAPGWPFSIGSGRKARTHLESTLKLAPDYPENAIVRMESRIKWRNRAGLKADLEAYKAIRIKARKTFTGEEWRAYRQDWEERWKKIQARAKSQWGDE
jgi:hypothetical protein